MCFYLFFLENYNNSSKKIIERDLNLERDLQDEFFYE